MLGVGLGEPGIDFDLPGTLLWTIAGCLIALFHRPSGPRRPWVVWLVPALLAGVLHGGSVASRSLDARGPVHRSSAVVGQDLPDGYRDRLRAALVERIEATFPDEGGMVGALLLADRSGVAWEVRDAFRRSGTSHLLAISGFHVGVLAGWVVLLLRLALLTRRRALIAASVIVWSYAALLGFPGSAVRAAMIFSLVTFGRVLGRPVLPLGGWGSALLLIAVATPDSVTGVGTQLSFLGSLGLILWADRWRARMEVAVTTSAARRGVHLESGRREAVLGAVAASAAAQWATLPLAAWTFQAVPLAGLPATLVATPLVAFALPGALLSLAAHTVHPTLSILPAAGVESLLAGLRHVVRTAGTVGPVVQVSPTTVLAAVVGGAGVLAGWRRGRAGRPVPFLLVPGVVLVVSILTAPIASWVTAGLGLRGSEVHFLDVGQGDAIALRGKRGRWVLVDTGPPDGDRLVRDLLRLGVARIDLLVLSHPDLDHIGGAAAVLRAFPVGAILDPISVRGGAWRELLDLAAERDVEWRSGRTGDAFELDGMEFRVLSPGASVDGAGPGVSVNDRSLVLRVSIDDFDLLLTGDVSMWVEEEIAVRAGDVEVLKVGHHGSRTSTSPGLLSVTKPELAVIQVGRRNRFGHPVPAVVDRLRGAGARVLRTDVDGRISIFPGRPGTDGEPVAGPDRPTES